MWSSWTCGGTGPYSGLASNSAELELAQLGLGHERAVRSGDRLALTGEGDCRVGHGSTAVRWWRDLIEALGVLVATVTARAQHVGEPHVGCMDVEERHVLGALVGERVRDTGRRREERSRVAAHLVRAFRAKRNRELAGEHEKGVGMPLVDVELGAAFAGGVAKPRQRELVVIGEEPQSLCRLVGHDLALARA